MSNVPARKVPRLVVRLYAALRFVVVAGTVVVLLSAAALTYQSTRDPWGAAVIVIAAMWLPQQLIPHSRYRRP